MDSRTLANLLEQIKSGNRKALEKLLLFAHTPVLWQCRRLLNDQQLAQDMTGQILKGLAAQINRVEDPEHFHRWIGTMTATRCMKMRQQGEIKEYIPENQDLSFPSNELSKAETAQVAQILADSLPEDLRICLLLSVCCRVGIRTISQMTGLGEDTVKKNIAEAELAIREQMQVYQAQGVVFAGTLTAAALLRSAMFANPNRSEAGALVVKVLPPVPPAPVQPPKKQNNTIRILLCALMALVLLLVFMGCSIVLKSRGEDPEETTPPSTAETTSVTETTQAAAEETTEAVTEATTEPTTEATTEPATEETTVPETTEAEAKAAQPAASQTTAQKPSSNPSADLGAPGLDIIKKPSGSDYNKPDDGHTHEYISMGTPGNPTCTKPGRVYRVCKYCNTGVEADDPNRPALGHDYQLDIVVPPTTTAQGYTVYKCTRCPSKYEADYVDPLPAPETQPPVVETQPPAPETQPPASETQPAVQETQAPSVQSEATS